MTRMWLFEGGPDVVFLRLLTTVITGVALVLGAFAVSQLA